SIIGIVLALILLSGPAAFGADVPVGFAETVVPGPSNGNRTEAVGLTFSINGRMWVWERGGRVWIRDTNQVAFALLLNISDEVANYGDLGLLGFAVDPNFQANGHIYLLYAVDRYHLFNYGTANYNPALNQYN